MGIDIAKWQYPGNKWQKETFQYFMKWITKGNVPENPVEWNFVSLLEMFSNGLSPQISYVADTKPLFRYWQTHHGMLEKNEILNGASI